MRSRKSTEEVIRTRLNFTLGSPLRSHLLARALHEQKQSQKTEPARHGPAIRRMIMGNSMMKLGIAAVVIAVLGIGIVEFLGTGASSGVVWAEVARKVEANRGFTFHQRIRIGRADRPDQVAYIAAYYTGSRIRRDFSREPEGEILRSEYSDFAARTTIYVRHDERTCLRLPLDERTLQARESGYLNPTDWVRQFLSTKYTELEPKIIEGVPCEGIETTDPTFGDGDPPPTSCVGRLWVSIETGYPVRLEYSSFGPTTRGDDVRLDVLWDRFQWDVELGESLFEPNIPPDYRWLPDNL